MFRSEDMNYFRLLLLKESAVEMLSEVGQLGCVQLVTKRGGYASMGPMAEESR